MLRAWSKGLHMLTPRTLRVTLGDTSIIITISSIMTGQLIGTHLSANRQKN